MRKTKEMLIQENNVLWTKLAAYEAELAQKNEIIELLKSHGQGSHAATMACAHDKAVDALAHVITALTTHIQKSS